VERDRLLLLRLLSHVYARASMDWRIVVPAIIGAGALIVGIANGDWLTIGIGVLVLVLTGFEIGARRRRPTPTDPDPR
jgi:hypothetical protein